MDRNAPMTIPEQPPKKKSKQVENKPGTLLSWVKPCTSDTEPGVVEETIRIKEQPESNCLQIFREQYPKQVLYFVKVNTNGKLETRTKGIADKCSDLTCTKKYALTGGPKRGVGKLMWATRSALPVILCLLQACTGKDLYAICSYRSLQKVGYVPLYTFSQIVVWYTATGLYITVHN